MIYIRRYVFVRRYGFLGPVLTGLIFIAGRNRSRWITADTLGSVRPVSNHNENQTASPESAYQAL